MPDLVRTAITSSDLPTKNSTLSTLFSLYLIYLSWQQGNISGIDTLITEINTTFRDVIGGYIIKAAVENAIKIGGGYLISLYETKLNYMDNTVPAEEQYNDNEYNP